MKKLIILMLLFATTAFARPSWLSDEFEYRYPIKVNEKYLPAEPVYDVQILITEDSIIPHVFQHASPTGADIFITTDDNQILDYTLERYDPENNDLEIWVEVPVLSKTKNGFFIYYGLNDSLLQ